ncbi:MAG: DUF523 domain-containing protein [Endomicrobia bacterium]|nr:DUF523 domain-containing protein [Endomicrobiia bacterium]
MNNNKIILVSACLLGINCKYNGTNNYNIKVVQLLLNKKIIFPVCPEIYVFGKKRKKIWYLNGEGSDLISGNKCVKIVNSAGEDVTHKLLKYCLRLGKLAKKFGVKYAILKEKSPSCGVNYVYVKNNLVKGCGVLTAVLKKYGIKVISEENL